MTYQNNDKAKADSLMDASNKKKGFAYTQNKIGESLVKKGLGDKEMNGVSGYGKLGDTKKIPTGRERIEIARKLRQEASKDSAQAVEIMRKVKSMKK